MKSALDDMDFRMEKAFNSWAEQGNLSLAKSNQLRQLVFALARQERKRRKTRAACGLTAAIAACIWLLFAGCPVAAATQISMAISQPQIILPLTFSLTVVLAYILIFFSDSQRKMFGGDL